MTNLWNISGQDAAISRLVRIVTGQRHPHAYIFCGPNGVGRRTTAEALAAVLLCEDPKTRSNDNEIQGLEPGAPIPAACGVCPSCLAFDAGTHGDFHMVSRQSARYSAEARTRSSKQQQLGIDVIREFVINPANQAPSRGRGRVFIIREAELMSVAAQNALLKTLEEPPAGVTLILQCTSPTELLPTTRSRCGLVRFACLPTKFVADRLTATGVDPTEARFWASFTEGSLGRSLRLSETDLFAFKQDLILRLARAAESGDADLADLLAKQTEAMADAAVSADKQLAKTLATRQAAGVVLGLLASAYRDAMLLASGATQPSIHADQADVIGRIADSLGPLGCADIVAQMARFEQLLWRNVNAKTLWDNVVISCATGAPLGV